MNVWHGLSCFYFRSGVRPDEHKADQSDLVSVSSTAGLMAFRRALKQAAVVGGVAVTTVFGLSQLTEYRRTQVSLCSDWLFPSERNVLLL